MSVDLIEPSGARPPRPALFSPQARALRRARFFRRARLLLALAAAILCGRKGARALAPAAWAFVGGLLWLAPQAAALGWLALPSLALFAGLAIAALIDARYLILPDGPLLVIAGCGVVFRLTTPDQIVAALAAAAFGFVLFRALGWSYEKARGHPGLGPGDARLFGLAGLWLGWDGLPTALLIATVSALIAALIARRDGGLAAAREPLPFGPHLALGLWLGWALGPLTF